MTRMWMVRAGKKAAAIDDFIEKGIVAIGWDEAAGLPLGANRDDVRVRLQGSPLPHRSAQIGIATGQIHRFLSELEVGDWVCTGDPGRRRYCIGKLLDTDGDGEGYLIRFRGVEWTHHVARDVLSQPTKNSLGAILTLFRVPETAAQEMLDKAVPIDTELEQSARKVPRPSSTGGSPEEPDPDESGRESDSFEEIIARASELIEDAVVRLDWEELQELAAGILRGMGYRAQISPKGSDRGVDVFASPDGLGLQEPRIFVEVKHRPNTSMGAPELRSFLGGRQAGDRCLYVSTGGFTKEARYEAERSNIPVTLIDLPRLAELLGEHYPSLDSTTMALVPLQRLYWPAG